MALTDAELQLLEEHLDGDCYRSDEWQDARKLVRALIPRLKTSEVVAERQAWKHTPFHHEGPTECKECREIQAWKESKGQ